MGGGDEEGRREFFHPSLTVRENEVIKCYSSQFYVRSSSALLGYFLEYYLVLSLSNWWTSSCERAPCNSSGE